MLIIAGSMGGCSWVVLIPVLMTEVLPGRDGVAFFFSPGCGELVITGGWVEFRKINLRDFI